MCLIVQFQNIWNNTYIFYFQTSKRSPHVSYFPVFKCSQIEGRLLDRPSRKCRFVRFCFSGWGRLSWDEHRSHKESVGGFPAWILHLRLHWRQSQRLPPEARRPAAGAAPSVTGTLFEAFADHIPHQSNAGLLLKYQCLSSRLIEGPP